MVKPISGRQFIPRPAVRVNEMAQRISATARQKVMAFCAAGAAVPASTILAQKPQQLFHYTIRTTEDDGNVKFWGGYDKLETVPDRMLFNTLKGFTQQKLFRMSAFTEVLRVEMEEGSDWKYENSIIGESLTSILALTLRGSIFFRYFDGTEASLFYYDQMPDRVPLIEEQPFTGSLEENVSLGEVAKFRRTEEMGHQTSLIFQLAGLKVNGPEDISAAKEAHELLTAVLALNDM